ncbi:YbfB/YjiJ family MFS transporter [Oryzifoliimicrobium ureilyticus]|uniref:YbfB/YjiJ family MFS transporter n=1 Tax=Oryzifoliimicrobium ureilyticus TaxID=3113724 RepID=UPI0030765973
MSETPEHAPLFPTAVAGMISMAAAMGFGRFSFTPILPGMMSDLRLSPGDAGLIASANFLGYLLGAILAGYGWAQGRERSLALAALAGNAIFLAAMAGTQSVALFSLIRFLAGLASAFVMIFTSSIVLGHAARAGNDHVSAAHFGGPGIGIALSSLMVMVLSLGLIGEPVGWRGEWIGGAFFSFAALGCVAWLLPQTAGKGKGAVEPALRWPTSMVLTTLSYGVFGFGYVITATFLVTIARQSASGRWTEFLCWLFVGLSAAVALFLWKPVATRIGLGPIYLLAIVVEAVGVLFTVLLPPDIAPVLGGLLFGGTFLAVTAYGLQIGRRLCPQSPRRAFAVMTAAFGLGQILGPIAAGIIAEQMGNFVAATCLGAIALLLSAILALPIIHKTS